MRFVETVACGGCGADVRVVVKGKNGSAMHPDPPCSWWLSAPPGAGTNAKALSMVKDAERKHLARARRN